MKKVPKSHFFKTYVQIHCVQTNVKYLPLEYPQNRYNQGYDGVDRMRTLPLY